MGLLAGDVRRLPPNCASTIQVFQRLANSKASKDKVALISDNSKISFSELQCMVDSLQVWLSKSVEAIESKHRKSQRERAARKQGKDEREERSASVKRSDSAAGSSDAAEAQRERGPSADDGGDGEAARDEQQARGRNPVFVAICLHRCPRLVALILAIWKLGWAYVPLDPTVPALRTLYVLRDSEPACVVTDSHTTIKIQQLERDTALSPRKGDAKRAAQDSDYDLSERILDIGGWDITKTSDALVAEIDAQEPGAATDAGTPQHGSQQIACVLYTSGSTGTPKGVRLTMENLMNRICWQWRDLPYKPDEVCLMSKSLTFVDSLTELFGPLLAAVPVVVAREPSVNPELLIKYVSQHAVTRLVLVPSLLKLLLLYLNTSKESIRALQTYLHVWVSSGEPLPGWLLNDFFAMFPGSKLVNLYGSTEVTGDVTCFPVDETNWRAGVKVPIGTPILNTALMVVRHDGQAYHCARDDMAGEIVILGKNVCAGYLEGRLSPGDRETFLRLSAIRIDDEAKKKKVQDFLAALDSSSEHDPRPCPSRSSSQKDGEVGRVLENNTKKLVSFIRSKSAESSSPRREGSGGSSPKAASPKAASPKAASPKAASPTASRVKFPDRQWSKRLSPSTPPPPPPRDALVYRTGDYGKVVGGQVVFEGRRDAQVKVRGVRVSLAEVEDAVHRSGYAESHYVLAATEQDSEDEDPVLVAYVVLKKEFEDRDTPITEDLLRCLRTFLPQVMVPRLVVVDSLPHLPSGKVDRQGLLQMYRRRMSYRNSKDNILILRKEEPIESRVRRIICSALGVDKSCDILNQNFFALGGTSITSVGVVVRLRELGLDVTLEAFLKAATIGEVVNDILKAKTMAEVMNLFCSPSPAPSAPLPRPTPAGGGDDDGDEDEDPVPDFGIPALHPDLPMCASASPQGPRRTAKGIKLALLHTLPVSQGVDKHAVVEMIAESFTTKNPLDVSLGVPRAAHRHLLTALWPRLVQDDLSFVVKDPQRGILGVVVNTDLFNEPQVTVPASMEDIVALHEPLEEEVRHQLRQEARGRSGRWVHNLFLATSTCLTPQDNVRLALHLEKELLRMAQTRQYHGVFTVNSNPLNQMLCENYLNYQRQGAVRVATFTNQGRRPFEKLPHDLLLVAMTKTL